MIGNTSIGDDMTTRGGGGDEVSQVEGDVITTCHPLPQVIGQRYTRGWG